MHDLINDLGKVVAGDICSKLEGDMQQKFSNRTRHSSYIAGEYDTVKKFEAFDQENSIRTFLPIGLSHYWRPCLTNVVLVDLLPKLGYLKVLSLSGYAITELLDAFENLKHLRYLNFSHTAIKCLPDSLCTLYHLETLLLKNCSRLQRLPSKIGNLVNLHYLDIRDAKSIERMPFGIDKLTNLQRLSDFIIGEGDFRIFGLENVNGEDAGEAKLNEKQGIDQLVLQWSPYFKKDTRNKEVDEWVLDSLRPPKKLEQLVIDNYGGEKFSTWIADSSFKNMLSLELRNCTNCESLPSIGRLLLLKDLSISGLYQVQKIGAELFGENQSNSFASLESLCFDNMLNWEEWDLCQDDEQASKFPSLSKLSIKRCPQLRGTLPIILQSLQKLEIYDCGRLIVSISSFALLSELRVEGCEELVDEGSLSVQKELGSLSQIGLGLERHPFITFRNCPQLVSLEKEEEILQLDKIPGVKSLFIRDCERFNRLPKVLNAFPFITRMVLEKCPGLVCFAESNFPPALKKLEIRDCKNLQYLVDEKENNNNKSMSSNTCLLEHLVISDCPSLIWVSSRGDICNQLQLLHIKNCSKLSSLFLKAKLSVMLKQLVIWTCPMLECIAQDFLETTGLESIDICDAKNIKSLPRGLDKLSHLQEIRLCGCPKLVPFQESGLPTTNLRVLSIQNCENFRALPKCINNFTSLRKLTVWECSADISFPEEGFPTNLTSLEISRAPKIYASLVEWGFNKLTSLQELDISGKGCSDVVSFPEEGIGGMLPPSLRSICIRNFENLEYICSNGLQHLTSLRKLYIYDYPKLASLSEKDMLLSLEKLYISKCSSLEEGCTLGTMKLVADKRPNGTTGEVYVPHLGDKPLNGGHPEWAIPAYGHNNGATCLELVSLQLSFNVAFQLSGPVKSRLYGEFVLLTFISCVGEYFDKRPDGTTGEVYVPLGDKPLNGGHPKRAIPAYGHNNGTTW
ncbi:putative disease resistance RPP13-like protein 1 [Gossypium hirsutum]|uniref:Disease resistance RPP13-like protein 1 n=1 Tax=Gossypium hirsutum TaxID=3635 RepID=A0ABM2Z645_GOSHI|nr:putative disease resistance RPP13-like protein 1 [Gossypium hirsutum]